jgi:predicted nucleic acid-binding protein
MTVGLDTSVIVRLLVGVPEKQAKDARAALEEQARTGLDPAMISDLVVGEAYFALRHHYEVPHRRAVQALRALLADPVVRATGSAADLLASVPDTEAPPGFMDRLIHGDYARHGATLLTFDRRAARLQDARLMG